MCRNKVLNFLFPGDIIRLEVSDDVVHKALNIGKDYKVDNSLHIEVLSVYYFDTEKKYLVNFYLRESTVKIYSGYLIINLKRSKIGLYVNYYSNFNERSTIGVNVKSLCILRGSSYRNKSIKSSYCSDFCPIKYFGKCEGNNIDCENFINYKINKEIPLIGDEISYYSHDSDTVSKWEDGIAFGLLSEYHRRVSAMGLERYNELTVNSFLYLSNSYSDNSDLNFFTYSTSGIIINSEKHLVIDFDFCDICVIDNCNKCSLGLLKELGIKWM